MVKILNITNTLPKKQPRERETMLNGPYLLKRVLQYPLQNHRSPLIGKFHQNTIQGAAADHNLNRPSSKGQGQGVGNTNSNRIGNSNGSGNVEGLLQSPIEPDDNFENIANKIRKQVRTILTDLLVEKSEILKGLTGEQILLISFSDYSTNPYKIELNEEKYDFPICRLRKVVEDEIDNYKIEIPGYTEEDIRLLKGELKWKSPTRILIKGSDLSNCDLRGTTPSQIMIDFNSCKSNGITAGDYFSSIMELPQGTEIVFANFAGSDISSHWFNAVNLSNSNFINLDLGMTVDLQLNGSDLTNSIIIDSEFQEPEDYGEEGNLQPLAAPTLFNNSTKLNNAILIGVDLINVTSFNTIEKDNLKGAYYYKVKFPEGFKPEEHGMINIANLDYNSISLKGRRLNPETLKYLIENNISEKSSPLLRMFNWRTVQLSSLDTMTSAMFQKLLQQERSNGHQPMIDRREARIPREE